MVSWVHLVVGVWGVVQIQGAKVIKDKDEALFVAKQLLTSKQGRVDQSVDEVIAQFQKRREQDAVVASTTNSTLPYNATKPRSFPKAPADPPDAEPKEARRRAAAVEASGNTMMQGDPAAAAGK